MHGEERLQKAAASAFLPAVSSEAVRLQATPPAAVVAAAPKRERASSAADIVVDAAAESDKLRRGLPASRAG